MGLLTEWKVFASLAVQYLGMPETAMPMFGSNVHEFKLEAARLMDFVLKVGNFGHNRDKSYFGKYPYLIRKAISFGRRVGDLYRHARIFPLDSVRFLPRIVINGVQSAIRGE